MLLRNVSDKYKTQEMCKRVVEEGPYVLEFIPDK